MDQIEFNAFVGMEASGMFAGDSVEARPLVSGRGPLRSLFLIIL
ncbi:MAG TPA: hypothetical protein VFS13_03185 [Steroidobacteraceae bacterium]|nr:hypothetical protein [Steroidobacteraceae bacterium]